MTDIIDFVEDANPKNEFVAEIRKKIIDKDDEWYFSDQEHLTNSMMSELKKSPLHLQRYLQKLEQPQKAYNTFGSAFHCSILEPKQFKKRFFVLDDYRICAEIGGAKPRSTKKYKEWKEEFIKEHQKKEELSSDDYEHIMRMKERVMGIPETRSLIELTQKEIIFADMYQGVKRKCKVDGIKMGDFLLDLKSTKDPVSQFPSSVFRYDYDRQAAWYSDICETPNVIFIAVEKTAPYTVGLFYVSEQALENGRAKYESWMLEYKRLFIEKAIPDLSKYLFRSQI